LFHHPVQLETASFFYGTTAYFDGLHADADELSNSMMEDYDVRELG
jgi:hypothetical protein